MQDFTQFDEQVCLYAKSWYKETNTMDDLRTILSVYCGMEKKYISDLDIMNMVSSCLHKVLARQQTDYDLDILYKDVWNDYRQGKPFFSRKTELTMTDIVESHLRVIRMKRVEYIPVLPAPDPKYLPLGDEKTLARWAEINKVKA